MTHKQLVLLLGAFAAYTVDHLVVVTLSLGLRPDRRACANVLRANVEYLRNAPFRNLVRAAIKPVAFLWISARL